MNIERQQQLAERERYLAAQQELKGVHYDVMKLAEFLRDYYVEHDPVAESVYHSFLRFHAFLQGKFSVGVFDPLDLKALRSQEVTVLFTVLDCIRRDKALIERRRHGAIITQQAQEARRKATDRILDLKKRRDRFMAAFKDVADAGELDQCHSQQLRELHAVRADPQQCVKQSLDGMDGDARLPVPTSSNRETAMEDVIPVEEPQHSNDDGAPTSHSDGQAALIFTPEESADPLPGRQDVNSAATSSRAIAEEEVTVRRAGDSSRVPQQPSPPNTPRHPEAASEPLRRSQYQRTSDEEAFGSDYDPEAARQRKLDLLWARRRR